jgi:ubiquinone/menaquinone biosynthesis C-methylase UbiE
MAGLHSHGLRGSHSAQTKGRVISWSHGYDPLVKVLTMGRDGAMRDAVIRAAGISTGSTVLDVGCGTGDLTIRAKRRAGREGQVYGIDPAEEMIANARRKAAAAGTEVNFQIGVIEALAFEAETFDAVLSSLMFHHLPSSLKVRGLAEIYRVLKPGGVLLVADMRRPTGVSGAVFKHLMMHGSLETGTEDLVPLMRHAGYTEFKTGHLNLPMLGFVRAVRPVSA